MLSPYLYKYVNLQVMILILGQKNDASTINVAEWLMYYNKKFLILNTDDTDFQIKFIDIKNQKLIIASNDVDYNLFETTSVWNRRLGISPASFTNSFLSKKHFCSFFMEDGDDYHYKHLLNESKILFEFIHYIVEKSSMAIGSFFSNSVNKLIVLEKAAALGLMVPDTYVCSSKNDLNEIMLINSSSNVITKAISEGVYRPHVENEYLYYSNVERVSSLDLCDFSSNFYPSLIQLEIEKQFDIRVFILMDHFFPMAIFSQEEEDAVTDFRKNDHYNNPLRCVPYKLPYHIEKQIRELMKSLRLNTGSIDLLLNNKGEYVFLEINPCGQYTMTSLPCNYLLDREIAKLL